MSDDDLDLVPVTDLLDAMARRFPTMVFLGVSDYGEAAQHYSIRYAGEKFACIGLGHYIAHDLSTQIDHDPQES